MLQFVRQGNVLRDEMDSLNLCMSYTLSPFNPSQTKPKILVPECFSVWGAKKDPGSHLSLYLCAAVQYTLGKPGREDNCSPSLLHLANIKPQGKKKDEMQRKY